MKNMNPCKCVCIDKTVCKKGTARMQGRGITSVIEYKPSDVR